MRVRVGKAKVNMPQYAPIYEWPNEPKCGTEEEHTEEYYMGFECKKCSQRRPDEHARTIRMSCALCKKVVVVRTLLILKPNPQDRTDEQQADEEANVHAIAKRDGETYMEHLLTVHRDHFDGTDIPDLDTDTGA